ncbi:MAG: class II fructose-bisphosphate aldolase [Bacillota bacterium]|jgi:fructose-bisphosphate aldolase class II
MIVNGRDLINKARDEHYAIGAFNVSDYVTVEIVLQAAEALHVPVILQTGDYANPDPESRKMSDWDAGNLMRFIRQRAEVSPVPVVIHLDHCPTYDGCVRAIQYGATSVMIDASMKPFEGNVALTNKVVEMARCCNVSVEAEIGHVSGHANSLGEQYTTVETAKAFYEATGVDMLAVSIGTTHGIYKKAPVLKYDLIKELREAIPVPLVMHGSSGLTPEQYISAVKSGIAKVNFSTYLQLTAGHAIRQAALDAEPAMVRLNSLISVGLKRGVEYVKEHIGYFGTRPII